MIALSPNIKLVLECFEDHEKAQVFSRIVDYEIEDEKYEALSNLCFKEKIENHIANIGYFLWRLYPPIIATKFHVTITNELKEALDGLKIKEFTDWALPLTHFVLLGEKTSEEYPIEIIYRNAKLEIRNEQTVHSIVSHLAQLANPLVKMSHGLNKEEIIKELQSNRTTPNIIRDYVALRLMNYLKAQKLLKNHSARYYFIYELIEIAGHQFDIDKGSNDEDVSRKKRIINSVRRCIENEQNRLDSSFSTALLKIVYP